MSGKKINQWFLQLAFGRGVCMMEHFEMIHIFKAVVTKLYTYLSELIKTYTLKREITEYKLYFNA